MHVINICCDKIYQRQLGGRELKLSPKYNQGGVWEQEIYGLNSMEAGNQVMYIC